MQHPYADRPDIGPDPMSASRARWAIITLIWGLFGGVWRFLWQLVVLAAAIRYLWHG